LFQEGFFLESLTILAWDNGIGCGGVLFKRRHAAGIMIDRNGGDHRDCGARGEIHRLLHDQRWRKHL